MIAMQHLTTSFSNPFEFILATTGQVSSYLLSIRFPKEAAYSSRFAIKDAFCKIDQLAEKNKLLMAKKFGCLAEREITLANREKIVSEFDDLLKSTEFSELREILAHIPQNQKMAFLHEIFERIECQLVAGRNYINNAMRQSEETGDMIKLTALDQATYQLILITKELKKNIENKKSAKVQSLLPVFIISNLKLMSFSGKKINEQELYETMADADDFLNLQNREETRQYLLALTN